MATTLNAAASAGLVTTADTSQILQLQTGGITGLQVDASQKVTFANSLTSPTLVTPTIDSAQVPTISGTAPLYMCRAWVNFNGTGTIGIRGSGNVSSLTDNGVGDYTVNFTTALVDVNYAWSAGGCDNSNTFVGNTSPTYKTNTAVQLTTSLRIQSFFNSRPTGSTYDNGVADMALICVSVFR